MPKKAHRIAPEVKADILRRIKEEAITVARRRETPEDIGRQFGW